MNTFCDKYKYKWIVLDEWGADVDLSHQYYIPGGSNIGEVIDQRLTYSIHLIKTDEEGWGQYYALYIPKKNRFSIYPLGDEINLRVKFNCSSIEECEKYLDLICEHNSLVVAPVNIKRDEGSLFR